MVSNITNNIGKKRTTSLEYKIKILRVLSKTKGGLTKYRLQNLEVSDYDPSMGFKIIHKRPDLTDKALKDLLELGFIKYISKEKLKDNKMRAHGIYKITKNGKEFIAEKNREALEQIRIMVR